MIKKIGIFRIKAKSIYNLSKILINNHNGKVPKTFEELEKLPGVGHKTASVVMSQGFGHPAFAIDTIFIDSHKDGDFQTEKCCSNRKRPKKIISQKKMEQTSSSNNLLW